MQVRPSESKRDPAPPPTFSAFLVGLVRIYIHSYPFLPLQVVGYRSAGKHHGECSRRRCIASPKKAEAEGPCLLRVRAVLAMDFFDGGHG